MSSSGVLLFSLLISFATLLMGLIVLVREVRKAYAWWFLAICIFGISWLITSVAANTNMPISAANIVNKVAFLSGFLAIYSGLIFTQLFPHTTKIRLRQKVFFAILLLGGTILSILPAVIGRAYLTSEGDTTYTTPSSIIFYVAIIVLTVSGIIWNLRRNYIHSVGDRKRILTVGIAFAGSSAFGILFSIVLPSLLGNWTSTFYNSLALLLLTTLITYAIIRHRLFDIRLAAVRTVAYVLALGTMAAIYFGLAYLASSTFFKGSSTTGVSMSPVNILLALILAFIFQPIKQFFDRITDSIFYRDRYNTDDLIADVGAIVTSTVDLKQLLETTAATIGRTIKASGTSFVVYRENKSPLQIGTKGHVYLTTGEIDDLRSYIDEKGSTIINIGEQTEKTTRRPAIITVLSRRRVALVVPLVERQGSIGFLLIDEQKGSGYVKHDIKALDTLTDELVVAVQNASSLQEVRDINTHLEQRINAATKELRLSNTQLKALDETKDEFISMASHQLRTPLTSIKGYISMVLDGDVGEINPTQRKLLSEAFASSERMVHLIGDFLNVSRLQTGKFIIDQKPTDLTRVVAEEVESIDSLVTSHNMTLVYKVPKNIPIMEIDEDKIRQVIMNFIDNAVYYSHPGSTIVIKLARRGESVELEVHDQGIGVPAEAQKRLFGKFFRAGNARRQRPDGTGIGLFLAKKVVVAQGGEMIFESTEGKGSVFGFRLPIHPKTPRHHGEE